MKIAACVILYNSDEALNKNIHSYINHVEKIYLVDNNEFLNTEFYKDFTNQSNIQIIHNGINEGIAKRLNQVCELAIQNGYDYLLTMDQDSYFNKEQITKYFSCIETINEKNVSMFGVSYQQENNETDCKYREAKFLITSGSIINLKLFKIIGGFDENLFIDFVDTEYCFRSIRKNFKIIEFSNVYMQHSLGKSADKYSLKTFKKTKRSFHSATRLYYMTRNFFYLQSIYKKKFSKELQILKKDLLNRIKNKLLYEKNRITTITFLLRALKHHQQKKMGKLD